MPIGGIGTGTISLNGRGRLQDWEVMNEPAKGFRPRNALFTLWAKPAGGEAVTRCLEGPVAKRRLSGGFGAGDDAGLPRFGQCRFDAAYPMAQVHLADRSVPLDVRLEAFNPLEPADAELSGMPVAILRYVLVNRSDKPVDAAVCGSFANFIGVYGRKGYTYGNTNHERDGDCVRGIDMRSESVPRHDEYRGTLALATTATKDVTRRISWTSEKWGGHLLDFWDDFSDDGRLDPRPALQEAPPSHDDPNAPPPDQGRKEARMPTASLAVRLRVPPKSEKSVTFLVAWHFPNRLSWTRQVRERAKEKNRPELAIVGNYYTQAHADAWDVAEKVAARLPELERRTVSFVRSVVESDLPESVREAALFNLPSLRSQTTFRLPDGRMYAWEGCGDEAGCCPGSCTHVWNYEYATPFLFGDLARSMREVELGFATQPDGFQSFRKSLPLAEPDWKAAAADGQMGTIVKLYREWRLSGDDAMLEKLWPAAKQALAFAWKPGGWDPDRDGVMEGCQHNTMDVEYFGPNPEIGFWYLAALRAGAAMADRMGDAEFAAECRRMAVSGAKFFDEKLFNSEYYEQELRLIERRDQIIEGLLTGMGTETRPDGTLGDPRFQVGSGCIADALVGQVAAHITNLGHLAKPANVKKTLKSILKHNGRKRVGDVFNHMRTYAAGEEGGILVCSYPRGERPIQPFPYWCEVWTGIEYTVAAGLAQEGLLKEAEQVVATTRARHAGHNRNPFDEPECGHHYARAMASWGILIAWTGFDYDANTAAMRLRASDQPATWFWSNGDTWGTVAQKPGKRGTVVTLRVTGGKPLKLERLTIGEASSNVDAKKALRPGSEVSLTLNATAR